MEGGKVRAVTTSCGRGWGGIGDIVFRICSPVVFVLGRFQVHVSGEVRGVAVQGGVGGLASGGDEGSGGVAGTGVVGIGERFWVVDRGGRGVIFVGGDGEGVERVVVKRKGRRDDTGTGGWTGMVIDVHGELVETEGVLCGVDGGPAQSAPGKTVAAVSGGEERRRTGSDGWWDDEFYGR